MTTTHTFAQDMVGFGKARDGTPCALTLFEVTCTADLGDPLGDVQHGQVWLEPAEVDGGAFACPVCGVVVQLVDRELTATEREADEQAALARVELAEPGLARHDLAALLRRLHAHGYWITAWYPSSNGDFECRLSDGVPSAAVNYWGADPAPLNALVEAMHKAGI